MGFIEAWLSGLPPILVYVVVGMIILLESMGIPLPGEITLVTASVMAVGGTIEIWGVAGAAAAGAIIGDSIGYAIGRRGGRPLLERMGRRFPKHFGPAHLARAERIFQRWGVWAVFFGRFVALLRILAGPLAGALHVPYRKFFIANAAGGICWAGGTAFAVYALGRQVEHYLKDFSWIALVLAVVAGIATTLILKRRAANAMHADPAVVAEEEAAERQEAESDAARDADAVLVAGETDTVPSGAPRPREPDAADPARRPPA